MPVDEKDISSSLVVRSRVLLENIFYWFGRGMPARRLPTRPRKSVREGARFRGMAIGSRGGHGREYSNLTHLCLKSTWAKRMFGRIGPYYLLATSLLCAAP